MMNEQPHFRFRRDLPPSPIRDPRGKKGTLLSCPGQGWARREPEEGHQGRLRSSPSSDLCPAGMTGKMASPADTSILDFYPPDCEKRNFCCSRDPLCSVLLQQPEQTNTGGKGGVAKPVTPPTRGAGLPQDSLERCRFTQRRGRGSSGVYPPTPGGHWVRVALSCSDQCEGKPQGGRGCRCWQLPACRVHPAPGQVRADPAAGSLGDSRAWREM